MNKKYEATLEDMEFQIIEKFNLPKQELLTDTTLEDIFYEEEELNFD